LNIISVLTNVWFVMSTILALKLLCSYKSTTSVIVRRYPLSISWIYT